MTTHAPIVELNTVTTEDTFIARIYIHANTVQRAGVGITGRQRYVQSVTDALQTFLLSGPILSGGSWEIRVTKSQSDEHGQPANTPKQNKKK